MLAQWIGVGICLIHSAMFSGLNLGFFGFSRLKLVVLADGGNQDAERILGLRKDAHLLLTTLLWGNVASNVLLALFAESLMTGVAAFFFSTIGITVLGEIVPQAYLTRHALKSSFLLVPIVRFYQILLYPLAKPTALLLDRWLGKERINYFMENEMLLLLERHARTMHSDLEHLETLGAINFLKIDDIKVCEEGEPVNPQSVISLPTNNEGQIIFPTYDLESDDDFLKAVNASGEKWVIITDERQNPRFVLDADQFLRDIMFCQQKSTYMYCHRPILIDSPQVKLGEVIAKLKVFAEHPDDDVVDKDIVLYWGEQKKIITGADIFGRLMRGIISRKLKLEEKQNP